MKLGEIIDLNILQDIQNSFSTATGFAAITVDYRGRPLLEYSGFSSFCNKLRDYPTYKENCLRSDAHGSLEAARRETVCIYKCHAGLVDFAVPIIVDGEYIASMMCGQVLVKDSDDGKINSHLIENTLGIFDNSELLDLYNKIPILSMERLNKTANLLSITLNYIVDQYILNRKNIKLLDEKHKKNRIRKTI